MQTQQQTPFKIPTRSRNVSGLLLGFVVLSLFAHGGVFLFYSDQTLPLPAQRFGSTFISAVIAPANDNPSTLPQHSTESLNPEKQSETLYAATEPKTNIAEAVVIDTITTENITAKTETSKKSNATPTAKIALTQTPEKALPHPENNIPVTAPDNINTATDASTTRQQQRNYLLGELQNRLSKYLVYPLRARRRGWQGEVTIAFHIDKRGQLGSVHLARSSGYSLLDHSALKAIAKLEAIDVPQNFGPLQAMDLQLPVHYRLQEG